MSKQKGIIKLEGNLGGISFYAAGGQHLARVASGPTKQRIETDEKFQRTRENNKEFGGAAKAAKAVRLALGAAVQSVSSAGLVSTLTKLFKSINLKGSGARGKRSIALSANKPMLRNVELNTRLSLNRVFYAPFSVSINTDRTESTISVPAFNAQTAISAPAGATHFKLISVLGVVSDFVHDDGLNSYEALVPEQNLLSANGGSSVHTLGANISAINIKTTLPGGTAIDPACSVVQCLGIEFYQQVGTNFYLFAQDRAMKIVNVF